MGVSTVTTTISNNPRGTRNAREKEKERTKLRECHRRAITSRMLAGLRQYGNFPLPARTDMNDVLAALAREAGWTVDPDGTTFRHSPPISKLGVYPVRSVESPLSSSSLKSYPVKPSLDFPSSVLKIDESPSPASLYFVVVPVRGITECENYGASPIDSHDCLETDQLDRFILNRAAMDFDFANYMLTGENVEKETIILVATIYYFSQPVGNSTWIRALLYCGLAPTILAGKIDPFLFEALYASQHAIFFVARVPRIWKNFKMAKTQKIKATGHHLGLLKAKLAKL